jgi:hypothetical protein
MQSPAPRRGPVVFLVLAVLLVSNLNGLPRLAAEAPPAAPALPALDVRFATGTSALAIPFEMDGGHILLRGEIAGSGPMWLGLDTGATGSLIDSDRARTLGLQRGESSQVHGAAGAVDAVELSGASIRLPGVELRDQNLTALQLDFLARGKGRDIAALLGYEVFSRFVVEIDYAGRRLHLYDPATFVYQGTGESFPLRLDGDHPYVRAQLVLPGKRTVEGEFVVDTGSPFSLMLAAPFVTEHRLLEGIGKTIGSKARGVGGEMLLSIGRLQGFRLGRFLLADPVTVFPQNFGGEITARGTAGNLGAGFLRRFRVIFDYSRGRMILEPNTSFGDRDEYDMSGVSLVAEGAAFDTIKVARLIEPSPAAEAGLRREDVIVAVDGKAAAAIGLANLRSLFREEGREVRLDVLRDGEALALQLKMRRLI